MLWAIAFAIALFGCTKITSQTSATRGNPWTVPGVVRIGVAEEPDDLNTVLGQQEIDVDISKFWAAYLIDEDDQNRLIPELVTVVPTIANGGISKDGRTITYHLRRGVRWHDGAPFGPADVIFTWHAIMNLDNPVPVRSGYDLIRSISAQGPDVVRIRLRHAYAPFVSMFLTSVGAYGYCVLPAHLLAQYPNIAHAPYNTMPVGTGPFRVVSYEPDTEVRMVANPDYWRGPPKLREVDVRIVPNDNTLATLVRTHEIDLYFRVPHVVSRSLEGVPGVRIVSAPFTRYADLGLNLRSPILADVRMRQALMYATDRPALIANVTAGVDTLADSDQPSFLWAHDAAVKQYPYDPAAANRLLDSAGWHQTASGIRARDGVPLRLGLAGVSGDTVSMKARELMQQQWRRVGIDTEIKTYPSDILYGPLVDGGIEQTGHYDVVLEGFANGADPDDSNLFECRWMPPQGEDVYRFCDPALDHIEEAALASNDLAVRKADYARIAQVLAEQLPIIPLWFASYDFAVNTDLHGFKPSHVGAPFWGTWAWSI